MKTCLALCCSFLSLVALGQQGQGNVTVKQAVPLMGTDFEVTVVAPNEEIGYINIDEAVSEIQRIEKLISSWDPASETSMINAKAGIAPVKVSQELYALIERSLGISAITEGAFDITYATLDGLWKFDGSMVKVPSAEALKGAVSKIGYKKIVLDPENRTVFLPEAGMRIGFGAIGKGYAADKAKELMIAKDVKGGIINASGDLTTWGTKATGEKWLVGISNPMDREKVFSWLPVIESSVATSGNYEKFITIGGKRYSHILDPRNGMPTEGILSVSIFAKQAELCDALATAVFVMGRDVGLHMINQLDGVEAVVVDAGHRVHRSSGIIFDTNQ